MMNLPECHDAAIEKAVDAVLDAQEFFGAHIKAGEVQRNNARYEARAAITAYLAALKEQGMMREAHGMTSYKGTVGDYWMAASDWQSQTGCFPALIIRMEPEQ